MRLLVAEDDSKLLKSLVHIFEVNKFNVCGVTDGIEALNRSNAPLCLQGAELVNDCNLQRER